MLPTKTIDLMRHGEPVGGRRYRGQIDDPLSEQGWDQMRNAVRGKSPWDNIVSSPLRRCREFAEELAGKLDVPLRIDERLREVGFGAWEGLTANELRASDPRIIARFYHDPVNNRPAGAEPLADFSARVTGAFSELLDDGNRHTLMVVHAGVIRTIVVHLLEAPLAAVYRISVQTASLTRIRCDGERPPTLVFQGLRTL